MFPAAATYVAEARRAATAAVADVAKKIEAGIFLPLFHFINLFNNRYRNFLECVRQYCHIYPRLFYNSPATVF